MFEPAQADIALLLPSPLCNAAYKVKLTSPLDPVGSQHYRTPKKCWSPPQIAAAVRLMNRSEVKSTF